MDLKNILNSVYSINFEVKKDPNNPCQTNFKIGQLNS